LPIGICEPHGQIASYGLDTIKAEYLCNEAAKKFGGIVAPTQGYQIHEAGFHAQWLEEVVGEVNPAMTAMPPHIILYFFLYQLRAFANAGFKSAVVITGHAGGNQNDFRLAASIFMKYVPFTVEIFADPELVTNQYQGDHAGKYEISQLLYIRPDLVDLSKVNFNPDIGRYALGEDALEASAECGKQIIEASLLTLGKCVQHLKNKTNGNSINKVSYAVVEKVWIELNNLKTTWVSNSPKDGQPAVSSRSGWKDYEHVKI
jgi:creatinine amidohydrolase